MAAASISMAFTWAAATSLTSTTPIMIFGIPGILFVIMSVMIFYDANPWPQIAGPTIKLGHIVTTSNFSSSDSSSM